MKTMFISSAGVNMVVDTETNNIDSLFSEREAIQRIYIAPYPMHVIYKSGDKVEEADVEEGDFIVTFYTDEFDKRMITFKNEDWKNNLESYKKRLEESKNKSNKCEKCDNECPLCRA